MVCSVSALPRSIQFCCFVRAIFFFIFCSCNTFISHFGGNCVVLRLALHITSSHWICHFSCHIAFLTSCFVSFRNKQTTARQGKKHSLIRSFTAPAKSSTLVACKFYYFILFSNTLFSPSRILAIVIIYSFVFVIISRWSTLELQRVRMRMCSGLLFPCIFRKNFVHFIH